MGNWEVMDGQYLVIPEGDAVSTSAARRIANRTADFGRFQCRRHFTAALEQCGCRI